MTYRNNAELCRLLALQGNDFLEQLDEDVVRELIAEVLTFRGIMKDSVERLDMNGIPQLYLNKIDILPIFMDLPGCTVEVAIPDANGKSNVFIRPKAAEMITIDLHLLNKE